MRWLTLLLLLTPSVWAEPTSIKANYAQYSENFLSLQGQVQLTHDLGIVSTEKATLHADEQAQLKSIYLQDEVQLNLKNGSQLNALSAVFDCPGGRGLFLGNELIKAFFKDASNSLEIQSIRMGISWNPSTLSTPKVLKNHLTAEQEVEIVYKDQLQAFGDSASYIDNKILLNSNGNGKQCRLVLNAKHHLSCDRIEIYPLQKQVIFKNPSGVLIRDSAKVYFSSKVMEWDDSRQLLILKEDVLIEDSGFGILQTQGQVSVFFKKNDEQQDISHVTCEGEAYLVHLDEKNEEHRLISSKFLTIDHQRKEISLQSKEAQPAIYQDSHGTISAQTVHLYYLADGKKDKPQKLFLDGDVRIVNQFASTQSQYILADHSEYSFIEKELALEGKENRVLLYDKLNSLELSAPALKIKRDVITNKDSVRGVGNVHFIFADDELEKLKKRFQFLEQVFKEPLS
ncbi:Uncharacterized protein PHSC3_000670 [Chlamydiales bacterium STE3]|nr:Uncharacterized protein PHSC3_000670 [Chlamydiales bacterium STE3]